jgi:DnaJ-class molecular chaperone
MAPVKEQDYYTILGVGRDADDKAIRSAFRKLARKHHPDINPNDIAAEEAFKRVNEAYEVLSDAGSRKLYDRYGADWRHYKDAGFTGDEPRGQPFTRSTSTEYPQWFERSGDGSTREFVFQEESDAGGFGDLLHSIFGSRRGERAGAGRTIRQKGEDLQVDVTVSFDEAYHGATRRLDIRSPESCDTCGGAGYIKQQPCPTCDATGVEMKQKTIEVKIPAGVKDAQRIRIAGQGGKGAGGAPNGDVFLRVHVRHSDRFERVGDDLRTDVDVPLYTAVLGGEVLLQTPTGRVALTIPPSSQNGRVFRLRGKGMPKSKRDKAERGDLLARACIVLPTELSDQERTHFEALRALQDQRR